MAFSIKDYEILDEIGAGGFGSVYRALQKSLDRVVALKSLSPQRLQNKDDIERFRREARAMAALSHDNIVSVLDYAYHSGQYYIVMEYVDGFTLQEALDRNVPPLVAILIMEKVAQALKCAHQHTIIHRDIKPGNILLGRHGRVKLADFGLAALRSTMSQHSSIAATVGTLSYMSPEAMADPKAVDARTDVFSFGCLLYQVLSGTVPFPGASIGEVSYKVLNEAPPPLDVDSSLEGVADLAVSCLNKDRDERPCIELIVSTLHDSIGDKRRHVEDDLDRFVGGAGKTVLERPSGPPPVTHVGAKKTVPSVAVAAVAVAIAAVVAVRLMRPSQEAPMQSEELPVRMVDEPVRSALPPGTGPVATDGPSPMTSLPESGHTCTLIIKGGHAGDTIFVNDSLAAILNADGDRTLSIVSGAMRLRVSGAGNREYTRKTEILPYRELLWDLTQGN